MYKHQGNGSALLRRGAAILTATAFLAGSAWWGAGSALANTAAPPAPANLRTSPTGISTDGNVVLTWDASTGTDIAYYQVFRYNGSADPAASELTYLGRTQAAGSTYTDQAPGEGGFKYAVMAVTTAGSASLPSAWASILVDLPANGAGTVSPDATAPAAVASLSAGGAAHSKNRTVTLTWAASQDADLWRYLVYRADGTQAAKMVGYVAAGTNTFADTVTADNAYTYYILAQDKTGNASAASANAVITVDATAPVVQITAPAALQAYLNNASLTVTATITEGAAGYEASAVKYYLDGALQASPTLSLSGLMPGAHLVKVEVTDRAGNTGSAEAQFLVNAATVDPSAARSLTAPAYSKSRTVSLSWTAPAGGAATGYKVYRLAAGAAPALAGSTAGNVTQFSDTVTADGVYSYYVVAENGTTTGQPSNAVSVNVDTVAPVIAVSSPKADERYPKEGALAVQVTVTDAGSGYDPAAVKLFLDGAALSGTSIDLAALADGSHTFKVEVADRAGNAAVKTVTFKVGAAQGDDGDKPARPDLIKLLQSLRSQIHHGQYNALMAKAKNGNLKSFKQQVLKHRGKFIAPAAAEKLLKALED